MNKEELIKDLKILQARHNKILGAIEYIMGKIQELDKVEKLPEESKKEQFGV